MAKPNRALKDSVFTSLFGEAEAFIELYSALLGVELPANTSAKNVSLDRVLFLDQVNDLAYLIGDTVVILVEHQSTVNPNMPLRFLTYVGRVYEKLASDDAKYGHALLKIPRPVLIVLYNGEEAYPEKKTLKLSDAFMDAGALLPKGDAALLQTELIERTYLELEVTVYNVNKDKNAALIQRSRMLWGYVTFIGKYKEKIKAEKAPEDAIREAIDECIDEDILAEYLREHGTEVRNMLLTEWSNEQAMRVQRKEGIEEGEVKKQREIAKNLLQMNASYDMVARATGLPLADIQSLQSQQP
ncbi:MAG: Rpn family recombination-promoting nuclease/putative transposase [Oscillospiraceae bacterium]|jgi:predicted transposase/invertase (TIGR01784 family)|nr:Rpn family recombination-promoting nuclease/putative transposase [Oscillospiraceae bacterium]